MHTRETDRSHPRGLGALAKRVAEHASALVRLELELAALELKRKVIALGVGIGLFAVGFLLATVAAALATFLSTWLALLIVALGLLALAAVLGLVGVAKIKKGTPPVPEQAIHEAKLTTSALKSNGR
jgi:hypothetical protein